MCAPEKSIHFGLLAHITSAGPRSSCAPPAAGMSFDTDHHITNERLLLKKNLTTDIDFPVGLQIYALLRGRRHPNPLV